MKSNLETKTSGYTIPAIGSELTRQTLKVSRKLYFQTGDLISYFIHDSNHAFILLSGKLKLYFQNNQKTDYFLNHLEPGQLCALSMICPDLELIQSIYARALEDSEGILVPIAYIQHQVTIHKSWGRFVSSAYHKQISNLMHHLQYNLFSSMDQRLENYLDKERTNHRKSIIQLSHQQIANELGSSREVISRLLKKMELQGKLKLKRNQIEIIV